MIDNPIIYFVVRTSFEFLYHVDGDTMFPGALEGSLDYLGMNPILFLVGSPVAFPEESRLDIRIMANDNDWGPVLIRILHDGLKLLVLFSNKPTPLTAQKYSSIAAKGSGPFRGGNHETIE